MWWFRRKSSPPSEPASAPPKGTVAALPAAPTEAIPFVFDVAIRSDRGVQRPHNEDQGRSVHPRDPETLSAKGLLVLVADGMGGHAAGEVASAAAADVIARVYYESAAPPPDALRAAFLEANRVIHEGARQQEGLNGMGTTCTALVLRSGEAWAAHVGDSRLYRCRAGRIERLTEDHSVVSEMVREGLITEEEARHHDQRNVITRALGIHAEVEPTVREAPLALRAGDVFLLSSDGLYDLVEEDEIADIVRQPDIHAAASGLVALANERGGHDNITVGLVHVRAAEGEAEAEERATREAPALS